MFTLSFFKFQFLFILIFASVTADYGEICNDLHLFDKNRTPLLSGFKEHWREMMFTFQFQVEIKQQD